MRRENSGGDRSHRRRKKGGESLKLDRFMSVGISSEQRRKARWVVAAT